MESLLSFCREMASTAVARRRVTTTLDALSDRSLADMGLQRSDIAAFIRDEWPWPDLPIVRRPRYRPAVRGCG